MFYLEVFYTSKSVNYIAWSAPIKGEQFHENGLTKSVVLETERFLQGSCHYTGEKVSGLSEVVTVRNLKKSFKKGFIPRRHEVLKGMSFDVAEGTITGFLGANGAGKTTTMKCLLGLVFPDSGEIEYFGSQPISQNIKRRIGFLPEHPYFYNYLTGFEFLRFYGELSANLKARDLKIRIESLLSGWIWFMRKIENCANILRECCKKLASLRRSFMTRILSFLMSQ
jgi:ABC-2 type transport system ATP-binding protein